MRIRHRRHDLRALVLGLVLGSLVLGSLVFGSWALGLTGVCLAQEEGSTLRCGSGAGQPEDTVTIPITLDLNDDVVAVSFGIEHDSLVVTPLSVVEGDALEDLNGGTGPDFFAVNLVPDVGTGITVATFFTLGTPVDTLPGGETHEIAICWYEVNASAEDGEETDLTFVGTLGDPAVEVELVDFDGFEITPETEDGQIEVAELLFVRGDGNDSGSFDIADVIFLINNLTEASTTNCLDALDMNDSGGISISDAIFGLCVLFCDDGPDAKEPIECGLDPTPDGIQCSEDYSGCD